MHPVLIATVVLALLTAIGAGLAFYMGWFKFSSRTRKGLSSIAFSVDEKKMAADKNKLADKVKAM